MSEQAAPVVPVIVVLPAEIDVTNADAVYQQLTAVLAPGVATLIADMTATGFCDSSGVHALMHAYETADSRDVQMRLAISSETSVSRVLQLIGVAKIVPVYTSLQDALDAN